LQESPVTAATWEAQGAVANELCFALLAFVFVEMPLAMFIAQQEL
jgi:hypothetical protein